MWVLDLPFRMRHPQVRWYPNPGVHAFIGTDLPTELRGYRSQPYTLSRLHEDSLNDSPGPRPAAAPMTPRPIQLEMAADVVRSLNYRGCVHLSADVGVGKTGATILAARTYLRDKPDARVLVIVDRPIDSTIPLWRNALAAFGDGGMQWLIVSPDQLQKVLRLKRQSPTAGRGHHYDLYIVDEAQNFRHLSDRTRRMWALTQMFSKSPPALITITATLGHLPSEYLALARCIASVRSEPVAQWKDVGGQLIKLGHPLEPSRFRSGDYMWTRDAREDVRKQQRSTEEVQGWLLNASPPAMVYRPAPWGPAIVRSIGVELTDTQRYEYRRAWREFVRANRIARSGNDTEAGLAALMRLRQKASFVRCAQTAQLALTQVSKGRQVVVSVGFVSTAAEPIADAVEAAGIRCARLYGEHPIESGRLAFQLGHAPVAVLNKSAAISLHAGEQLADGRRATTTPRVGIFHAPVTGIAAKQTIGRTHRFGSCSPWVFIWGVGTIEETAARTMVERAQSASASGGGSVAMWGDVASAFGVEWLTLPESAE